jgi:hypothetical protein
VRSDHGGHAPVQHARERDLLARGLGVKVDDDDTRAPPGVLNELVDQQERMHGGRQEERALEVDDGDGFARARVDDGETASGTREVGRPHDAVARLEQGNDVAVTPDVVAGRQDVGARGEQLLGKLCGYAHAVRDVLAVHDAKVRLELVTKLGEARLDGPSAGWPEHVSEKEDAHTLRVN